MTNSETRFDLEASTQRVVLIFLQLELKLPTTGEPDAATELAFNLRYQGVCTLAQWVVGETEKEMEKLLGTT